MAWVEITEADVQTRLAGAELSAYRSAAKASGQADPLSEIITAVVDEVRGYIAACDRNTLGAGTTIPSKLKSATLNLIRYRLITRLPIAISDERKEEYRDAINLLERVSDCRFAVEDPITESTETIASAKPLMGERTLTYNRDNQDGA
jgi:phage gp36-like protein